MPKSSSFVRNRVKELRTVRAGDLAPDPRNYRRHPKAQQDALRGVLKDIGYADALLARETPEGLRLIDGHLRASLDADAEVPVLVLDLDEEEAGKLLLTLDPLAAMALNDQDALLSLLESVRFDDAAVNAMLEALANGDTPPLESREAPDQVGMLSATYQVLIECATEEEQLGLLQRFMGEGLQCRALVS